MLLSDSEIRAEIAAGRLVFEPAVAPARIGVAVDLTLHDTFWRSRMPAGTGIQVEVDSSSNPYDYLAVEKADSVLLAPGGFLLGETAEEIGIPEHLCGLVEGKSGTARHGLIVHCTAPKIDPGWGDPVPKRITLEIVNHGTVPLRLRAGTLIAQLLVARLGLPATAGYAGVHGAKGSEARR
jgi:dCTP deaminase